MKPKKKTSVSNKKTTKKPAPKPKFLTINKTLITTKEKTYNTI